jgi:hypothetical protein
MASHLKKEFDERAVNRARNIISKNFTARTMVGSGYEKIKEKHSEGDVWEEDVEHGPLKTGLDKMLLS